MTLFRELHFVYTSKRLFRTNIHKTFANDCGDVTVDMLGNRQIAKHFQIRVRFADLHRRVNADALRHCLQKAFVSVHFVTKSLVKVVVKRFNEC